MRNRDMETASHFGILDRVKELESKLNEINYVEGVEFDLDGFWSDIYQVIVVPKYDIPTNMPDYFEVRHEMLNQILDVTASLGLKPSGDSIEDYGGHFYIVRNCDKSWVNDIQMSTGIKPGLAVRIQNAEQRTEESKLENSVQDYVR